MGANFTTWANSKGNASELDFTEPFPLIQGGVLKNSTKTDLVYSSRITIDDGDGSDYELSISDAFKTIYVDKSGANTITIPAGVFTLFQSIRVVKVGVGDITFVSGTGSPTIISSLGSLIDSSVALNIVLDFFAGDTVFLSNGTPLQSLTSGQIITALGFTPANVNNQWTRVNLTAADRVFASTSYADITSLTFAITSGQRVEIRAMLYVDTANTSEGYAASINGPTLTATRYFCKVFNNSTSEQYKAASSYDGAANSTTSADNAICSFYGRVLTSANGTIAMRFKCETGGVNVTVLRGSYVEYRVIT